MEPRRCFPAGGAADHQKPCDGGQLDHLGDAALPHRCAFQCDAYGVMSSEQRHNVRRRAQLTLDASESRAVTELRNIARNGCHRTASAERPCKPARTQITSGSDQGNFHSASLALAHHVASPTAVVAIGTKPGSASMRP